MNDYLREIEQATLRQLLSAKEGAESMADLFQEDGLGSDRDNWKAVAGLLEQAIHRFPEK
jgi:hypothetical protein